ncbi:hypothetical protein J6590_079973 [Homalodisca vitripennis]|nr:hypothetical protein J6590_079973 [Homalodisca vitripennis]
MQIWNADGLANKRLELGQLLTEMDVDVALLQGATYMKRPLDPNTHGYFGEIPGQKELP